MTLHFECFQNKHLIFKAQQFAPECKALVKLAGSCRNYSSIALDAHSGVLARIRLLNLSSS